MADHGQDDDDEGALMGKIGVHEFITLDGVFEDPSWTAPYGFPDAMGAAIGALTGASAARAHHAPRLR